MSSGSGRLCIIVCRQLTRLRSLVVPDTISEPVNGHTFEVFLTLSRSAHGPTANWTLGNWDVYSDLWLSLLEKISHSLREPLSTWNRRFGSQPVNSQDVVLFVGLETTGSSDLIETLVVKGTNAANIETDAGVLWHYICLILELSGRRDFSFLTSNAIRCGT